MKITICNDDCEVLETYSVKTDKPVYHVIENALVNAGFCGCADCDTFIPESETVELNDDLYCPACAKKRGA